MLQEVISQLLCQVSDQTPPKEREDPQEEKALYSRQREECQKFTKAMTDLQNPGKTDRRSQKRNKDEHSSREGRQKTNTKPLESSTPHKQRKLKSTNSTTSPCPKCMQPSAHWKPVHHLTFPFLFTITHALVFPLFLSFIFSSSFASLSFLKHFIYIFFIIWPPFCLLFPSPPYLSFSPLYFQ